MCLVHKAPANSTPYQSTIGEVLMSDEVRTKERRREAVGPAMLAGLLLQIAILFVWADAPSDVAAILLGMSANFPEGER